MSFSKVFYRDLNKTKRSKTHLELYFISAGIAVKIRPV
jgi:hypothetical protein